MVLILMGVCGCGKSTVGRILADRLGWTFHDADEYHLPDNISKMAKREPLTDEDRQPWLQAMARAIQQWLEANQSAILACSALKASYRCTLIGKSESQVRFVYMKGSASLLRKRLAARTDHFMPTDLLESQFQTLEEPSDAIVVDVAPPPQSVAQAIQKALGLGA